MTKIKKIILIILGVMITTLISGYIYLGVYKPAKVLSPPTNGLYQNNADMDFEEDNAIDKFIKEKNLYFIAKHRIAKEKYGFVKKIEIKKKSGIEINHWLYEDEPEDLVFGVYRDSKCSDVIEEEQGSDLVGGIRVKLEKGTYYIGIWTKDITATYKIPVLVDCCYLYPKATLKENKKIYFSMGDKNQVNTFTIVAKKTGRIKIRGSYTDYAYTMMKDENGKNVKNLSPKPEDYDSYYDPVFKIEKGKKYKLKIKSGEQGVITDILYLKYNYLDED